MLTSQGWGRLLMTFEMMHCCALALLQLLRLLVRPSGTAKRGPYFSAWQGLWVDQELQFGQWQQCCAAKGGRIFICPHPLNFNSTRAWYWFMEGVLMGYQTAHVLVHVAYEWFYVAPWRICKRQMLTLKWNNDAHWHYLQLLNADFEYDAMLCLGTSPHRWLLT